VVPWGSKGKVSWQVNQTRTQPFKEKRVLKRVREQFKAKLHVRGNRERLGANIIVWIDSSAERLRGGAVKMGRQKVNIVPDGMESGTGRRIREKKKAGRGTGTVKRCIEKGCGKAAEKLTEEWERLGLASKNERRSKGGRGREAGEKGRPMGRKDVKDHQFIQKNWGRAGLTSSAREKMGFHEEGKKRGAKVVWIQYCGKERLIAVGVVSERKKNKSPVRKS